MKSNLVNIDKFHIDVQSFLEQASTPVYVAINKELKGVIAVADVIKPTAKQAVKQLNDMNIDLIMVTGDHENTASTIAKEAGIKKFVAEVLPEDKINVVRGYQQQGKIVAMVGDGINDAPALAQSDVGIAIGTGTDIAISSSEIVIIQGDPLSIPKAINLSKKTVSVIRQNLFFAFIYNIIGIPIAAGILYPFTGILLSPIIAALAMSLSSISVLSNSLRLKSAKI